MNMNRLCRRLILTLAGAFLVSAWLYCLATIHTQDQLHEPRPTEPDSRLVRIFRDWGASVLAVELAGIALVSLLWMWRERHQEAPPPTGENDYNGRDPADS